MIAVLSSIPASASACMMRAEAVVGLFDHPSVSRIVLDRFRHALAIDDQVRIVFLATDWPRPSS